MALLPSCSRIAPRCGSSRPIGPARLPTGAVHPLEHLPVLAVAGPALQFPAMTDRRPAGTLGVDEDPCGGVDLVRVGSEGLQDRPDLVRVDAPHAGIAELARRARCR